MPKRLYARSLIIIITPMILLQSVVAFVFMERHWQTVTQRLSEAVVRDIAAIIDMIGELSEQRRLRQPHPHRAGPPGAEGRHPAAGPAAGAWPEAVLLDPRRMRSARKSPRQINRPFWIDTVGNSNIIEIRIQLEEQGAAGLRAAQPGLCLQHPYLPALDGRHVAGAADDRDPLPAQPDPADHPAGRGRREFRQGPADAAATSARAAPRRCAAPASPSSRCASASSARSTSARRC